VELRAHLARSYDTDEWAQPGALLHIDAFSVQRFDRPGHWAHGDRSVRERGLGKSVVVGLLDDHSRLVYGNCTPARPQRQSPPPCSAVWRGCVTTAAVSPRR
jgi:hypothetical protein